MKLVISLERLHCPIISLNFRFCKIWTEMVMVNQETVMKKVRGKGGKTVITMLDDVTY